MKKRGFNGTMKWTLVPGSLLILAAAFALFPDPPKVRRTALVIAVQHYAYVDSPTHTGQDAANVSRALGKLGFDVEVLTDPSNSQLAAGARDYLWRLRNSSVGVFFFAGYAVSSGRKNFLLPADANVKNENSLPLQAFDLDRVFAPQTAASPISIVIVDSASKNPFPANASISQPGLVSPRLAQPNVLIAFSDTPGQPASFENARDGRYASALAESLALPDVRIQDVFVMVQRRVSQGSGGKHQPWYTSNVNGDFYLSRSTALKDRRFALDVDSSSASESGDAWALEGWACAPPTTPRRDAAPLRCPATKTPEYLYMTVRVSASERAIMGSNVAQIQATCRDAARAQVQGDGASAVLAQYLTRTMGASDAPGLALTIMRNRNGPPATTGIYDCCSVSLASGRCADPGKGEPETWEQCMCLAFVKFPGGQKAFEAAAKAARDR